MYTPPTFREMNIETETACCTKLVYINVGDAIIISASGCDLQP